MTMLEEFVKERNEAVFSWGRGRSGAWLKIEASSYNN